MESSKYHNNYPSLAIISLNFSIDIRTVIMSGLVINTNTKIGNAVSNILFIQ